MSDLHRPATRNRDKILCLERGVESARNQCESKLGSALLRQHADSGRALTATLSSIDRQFNRRRMHLAQERSTFVQRLQALPDPTILIERPPLARPPLYAAAADGWTGERGYMRPTRPHVKRASHISTIDAFSIRARRKLNTWQSPGEHRICSVVLPAARLSAQEMCFLQDGLARHQRLTLQGEARGRSAPARRRRTAPSRAIYPLTREPHPATDDRPHSPLFITDSNTCVKTRLDVHIPSAKLVSFGDGVPDPDAESTPTAEGHGEIESSNDKADHVVPEHVSESVAQKPRRSGSRKKRKGVHTSIMTSTTVLSPYRYT